MTEHKITPDGESTENWAMRQDGFMGTVKQLLCCARCGETIAGGYHKPMHIYDMFKPTKHCLCDECFDALPE